MKSIKKLGLFLVVLLMMFSVGGCTNNNEKNAADNQETSQGNGVSLPGVGPNTIADIVKKSGNAVVKIETVVVDKSENPLLSDPFFRQFLGESGQSQTERRAGLGSGFIISDDGYILTNEHVIDGADEITVQIKGEEKPIKAQIIGSDFDLDLAVLKIDTGKKLSYIKLGKSDDINVGNWVIAIGSPYGLEDTVTVGVISAKERPISVEDRHYNHLLQTDASINPGNSGGPLLNLNGEVVGINTAVNAQAQGIGFAIPTSTVQNVLQTLIKEGRVIKPWMGVQIQTLTPEIAEYFQIKEEEGILITGVLRSSPAQQAGLKPGDIIIALNDQKAVKTETLTDIIQAQKIGSVIKVTLIREDQKLDINLKIAEMPTTGM